MTAGMNWEGVAGLAPALDKYVGERRQDHAHEYLCQVLDELALEYEDSERPVALARWRSWSDGVVEPLRYLWNDGSWGYRDIRFISELLTDSVQAPVDVRLGFKGNLSMVEKARQRLNDAKDLTGDHPDTALLHGPDSRTTKLASEVGVHVTPTIVQGARRGMRLRRPIERTTVVDVLEVRGEARKGFEAAKAGAKVDTVDFRIYGQIDFEKLGQGRVVDLDASASGMVNPYQKAKEGLAAEDRLFGRHPGLLEMAKRAKGRRMLRLYLKYMVDPDAWKIEKEGRLADRVLNLVVGSDKYKELVGA